MITIMLKFNFRKGITCRNITMVLKTWSLVKLKWVWWNWILVSKTTWFLSQIARVRNMRIGQRLIRENFLTLIDQFADYWVNLLIGHVTEFWVWIMFPILCVIGSFEKVSMKVSFGKCGEIVSPSNFEIVARTHARLPYSFLRLMVFHSE